MIRLHLKTGLAWTKSIDLECDIRGDILQALDDYFSEHGKEGFPVKLYELDELDDKELEAYMPINGGEFYIEGVEYIEEL